MTEIKTPKQPPSEWLCSSCRQPKSALKIHFECGLCQDLLCKKCAFFLKQSEFSFLKTVPEELTHAAYCGPCHHKTVAPALESYAETMRRAESIFVFEKTVKHVPVITSSKQKLSVENCPDRDETILRLAFQAAALSFNAIIKVELVCKKIRMEAYQTSSWSGTGYPAKINDRMSQD